MGRRTAAGPGRMTGPFQPSSAARRSVVTRCLPSPTVTRRIEWNIHHARSLAIAVSAAAASGAALADATAGTEKGYWLQKCAKPVASVVVGKVVCKSAAC